MHTTRATAEDPQDRDRDRAPGARPDGGAVPLGLQGQRHRVLRGAPVHARRRHPPHRLERVGAHERHLRQAVHRRARDDRAAAGRHVGVGALRLARAGEARADRRAGGGAGLLGDQEQRPRRPDHLHRRRRALRAAEEGQEARAARGQRDPVVHAPEPAHRSQGRPAVPGAHRAPARGRVPGVGFSRDAAARTSARCASRRGATT